MKIITKRLTDDVKSCSGHIVYVVDDNNKSIEADICELDTLGDVILNFKRKYEI